MESIGDVFLSRVEFRVLAGESFQGPATLRETFYWKAKSKAENSSVFLGSLWN